jgi:hypothetical protein
LMHIFVLVTRGEVEVCCPIDGDDGKQRVSDAIIRGVRGVRMPPRTRDHSDFYKAYFSAILRLHELGVHRDVAQELFRTHFHDVDMETWGWEEGWAAESLSRCVMSLLTRSTLLRPGGRSTPLTADERVALVGQAKEVAARAIPLLGGPWGDHAHGTTCQVRRITLPTTLVQLAARCDVPTSAVLTDPV